MRVVFEGNGAFSDSELRLAAEDELSSFHNSGRRRADADDAAFQMLSAYRRAGYYFSSVRYRLAGAGDRGELRFIVDEGPLVVLDKISFSGNTVFDEKELRTLFGKESGGVIALGADIVKRGVDVLSGEWGAGVPFVRSDIDGALSSIRGLYYERGYLDVVTDEPEVAFSEGRNRANVSVTIREGNRYLVESVTIGGKLPPEALDTLVDTASALEGKPFFPRRKAALRSLVLETCGRLGYPEAEVMVVQAEGERPEKVRLEVFVKSGPQVSISEIVIEGNRKTRTSHIRRLVDFETGDFFTLEKKQNTFRALFRTGLFSRVEVNLGEGETAERRPVVIRLEEAPSREVSAEIGWGSYELLRGRLTYRALNLTGRGLIAGVELCGSLKGENLVLGITDPLFFGADVTAGLDTTYRRREEPSFTRREVGAGLTFSRELFARIVGTAGYRLVLTDLSGMSEDPSAEGSDDEYRLATVQVQLSRDTRNDIFFPSSGHRATFNFGVADPAVGSEISYVRFFGGGRLFYPLTSSTVVGARAQSGFIVPTRDQISIPLGDRFFNGGENTVRSFDESELGPRDPSGDPAGGLAYNVLSVELRQRLAGNWAGTVFVDLGNVSPNRTRAEEGEEAYTSRSEVIEATFDGYFSDFRPAVGLGLQYMLPVGPARIDGAWNPDRRPDRGEPKYQFHLSVGMAF